MAFTATPKRMYFGTPATTDATLYTAPSVTPGAIVKQILLVNTTATAATVTLALNGTAATAANQILAAVSVAANQVITLDCSQVLNSGDTIHGLQGTSSACNVLISGLE